MVLKRSKFGANTGNSLRKCLYSNQVQKTLTKGAAVRVTYRVARAEYEAYDRYSDFVELGDRRVDLVLQCFLYHDRRAASQLCEVKLGEDFVELSTVALSLNKHGRWDFASSASQLASDKLFDKFERFHNDDYFPWLWFQNNRSAGNDLKATNRSIRRLGHFAKREVHDADFDLLFAVSKVSCNFQADGGASSSSEAESSCSKCLIKVSKLDETPHEVAQSKKQRKQQRRARHNAHFRGTQRFQSFQRAAKANEQKQVPEKGERAQLTFKVQELHPQNFRREVFKSLPRCTPKLPRRVHRKAAFRQFLADEQYDYLSATEWWSEEEEEEEEAEEEHDEVEQDVVLVEQADEQNVPCSFAIDEQVASVPESPEPEVYVASEPAPTPVKTNTTIHSCACCDWRSRVRGGVPASLGKIWVKRADGKLASRQPRRPWQPAPLTHSHSHLAPVVSVKGNCNLEVQLGLAIASFPLSIQPIAKKQLSPVKLRKSVQKPQLAEISTADAPKTATTTTTAATTTTTKFLKPHLSRLLLDSRCFADTLPVAMGNSVASTTRLHVKPAAYLSKSLALPDILPRKLTLSRPTDLVEETCKPGSRPAAARTRNGNLQWISDRVLPNIHESRR